MKKIIYLYLLGILNICHTTFAMDIDKSLKMAEDYANKHQWKDVFDIIDKLKAKNIRKAWAVEIQIKRQKADWEKEQELAVPLQQKWLFIKQMPPKTQEFIDSKSDWNVTKKKELILNLDATDAMMSESFATLIEQAKNNQLPFILLMIQSGDHGQFIHFYEANLMKGLVTTWLRPISAHEKIQDPINRQRITNIEIYVVGDDRQAYLLKDNADMNYLQQFTYYKKVTPEEVSKGLYNTEELKPELEKPGIAQVFIANLYKKQEQPSKPELQQLERLWLSWALPKFAPEDAAQKEQASKRLNAIPNRPELVSKKVEIELPTQPIEPVLPAALLSTLQNLGDKLRQVADKLKQL